MMSVNGVKGTRITPDSISPKRTEALAVTKQENKANNITAVQNKLSDKMLVDKNEEQSENTFDEGKVEQEHDIIKAIEKANKHIRTYDRKLEFSIHEATKQIMVKVINTENDSVIREIPSEKILDMVAHMWEVAGILVDEKR